MKHELKTWPEYFKMVASGMKPFELRKNDRGFKVGDTLILLEYNPKYGEYTGRKRVRKVTCVVENFDGLEEGYCILGLRR